MFGPHGADAAWMSARARLEPLPGLYPETEFTGRIKGQL